MVSRALTDGVCRAYRVALLEGKTHEGAIEYVVREKGLPKDMVVNIAKEYSIWFDQEENKNE